MRRISGRERWTTSFFCVWKRSIRSSMWRRRGLILKALDRLQWWRWTTDEKAGTREQGTGNRNARAKAGLRLDRWGGADGDGRVPAGYAESAEVCAAAGNGVFCRSSFGEAAGGEHRGARRAA